jgi:uncharacterized membrane protein
MRAMLRSGLAVTLVLPLVAAGLTAAATSADAANPTLTYTIADWGAFSVGTSRASSYGGGLNLNGVGVGQSYYVGGIQHATLYKGGVLTDLGALNATDSSDANAINQSSRIVGEDFSPAGSFASIPVEWTNGHIARLAGSSYGRAVAINNAGYAVGSLYTSTDLNSSYPQEAVEYANGRVIVLHGISNGVTPPDSIAAGIDDSDVIVGAQLNSTGATEAVRFSTSSLDPATAYPDLAGSTDDFALAIADSNTNVVGDAVMADGSFRAVSFAAGQPAKSLGLLDGRTASEAYGVNASGIAVGSSYNLGDPDSAAAVMYAEGKIINLNNILPADSGWVLEDAYSINDDGQISGSGLHNGVLRAFTLTPHITPTPKPVGNFTKELLILIGLLPSN